MMYCRNTPIFSGKIISPIWIKAAREFQRKSQDDKNAFCSSCGCTGGCNMCQDISMFNTKGMRIYE